VGELLVGWKRLNRSKYELLYSIVRLHATGIEALSRAMLKILQPVKRFVQGGKDQLCLLMDRECTLYEIVAKFLGFKSKPVHSCVELRCLFATRSQALTIV